MRRTVILSVGLVLLTLSLTFAGEATCPGVTVCFTPGHNCTQTIVQALGSAQRTILAQAYSFTSAPIAKARLDAHTRGVQVQVILDKSGRGARPCRNASEACQSW
jgi:phosphatidylserine/phosphatidylglycerophosphate/cardiolipin synthase-like enzyme